MPNFFLTNLTYVWYYVGIIGWSGGKQPYLHVLKAEIGYVRVPAH